MLQFWDLQFGTLHKCQCVLLDEHVLEKFPGDLGC